MNNNKDFGWLFEAQFSFVSALTLGLISLVWAITAKAWPVILFVAWVIYTVVEPRLLR